MVETAQKSDKPQEEKYALMAATKKTLFAGGFDSNDGLKPTSLYNVKEFRDYMNAYDSWHDAYPNVHERNELKQRHKGSPAEKCTDTNLALAESLKSSAIIIEWQPKAAFGA